MNEIDYQDLGLKVGLEFHQRLDTDKLFCSCSSEIKESEPYKDIERKIRPAESELGEMDPSAVKEAIKDKDFLYDIYRDSTCIVETDSEPPHPVDKEAFNLSLVIARMLNCKLFDEINFMRKTVVDGSNTTGFQRTAMIGHDGKIEEPLETEIEGVFLEEESAGIVGEEEDKKRYRLDRLGIPLVEIATGIIKGTPSQIKETALRIGTMLRTTGKVKRGIGTIRQDLNISIEGGSRVEVKGVQEIDLVEEIIRNEVKRQLQLIEIKKELKSRGIEKVDPEIKNLTSYFEDEAPGFMKKAIGKGGGVYGYVLEDFKGIMGTELLPDHRFGTELAHIAQTLGIDGIIHTDEDLSNYNIEDNVEEIREAEGLKDKDSILLVSHEDSKKAKEVLGQIKNRINQATQKIPQETRRALEDGTTQYLRPLGGEKRMYPETDVPTIKITPERRSEVEDEIPPKPERIIEELEESGISLELAKQTLKSPYVNLVRDIISETEVDPTTIASTFTAKIKEIEENTDQLTEQHFKQIFKSLEEGKFPKDGLKGLIKSKADNPASSIEEIIQSEGLSKISEDQIEKKIKEKIEEKKELVEENSHRAFKVIMGQMMSEYGGRVNGETVSRILEKKLE